MLSNVGQGGCKRAELQWGVVGNGDSMGLWMIDLQPYMATCLSYRAVTHVMQCLDQFTRHLHLAAASCS